MADFGGRTTQPPARLTIQEADGSPTGQPSTLKLPNGTVTDNGDGSFTYTAAGGGGGGSANVYDPTVLYLEDHFMSGAATSGQVSESNWAFSGTSASVTFLTTETGRIGIARLVSAATNPSTAAWHLRAIPTTGILLPGDLPWDMAYHARCNLNGGLANASLFRIGLSSDPVTTGDPSHAIYFEKLAADTNWFAVTRASSVQTRTDTTVAYADATFVRFRIRRESAGGNILFSVNAGTDISHSANIPTAALMPSAAMRTTEAVIKHLDLHRTYLKATGIASGNFS